MPRWLGYRSYLLLHSESSTSPIRLNTDKVIVKLQPECIETISLSREKIGGEDIFEQVYRRVKVINKEKHIKGTFFPKLLKLRRDTQLVAKTINSTLFEVET